MLAQKNYLSQHSYRSELKDWYEQASVKNKHRQHVSEDELQGKVFFPPELFPVASHPIIQGRGQAFVQEILIRRLYIYLDFTENLEHEVVNQVVFQIARGQLGIDICRETKLDAYKIYVDEAHHAMFSADLKNQVEEVTGIPAIIAKPRFLQRLGKIQESVSPELREIVRLFFTIISETLISGILAEVPRNKQVVNAVREVILDHARDERRHHAYFASLLGILWPQLKLEQQAVIGPLLPQFFFIFLEPDFPAIKVFLEASGLTLPEINLVLEESYPQAQIISGIRNAAKATLKYFKQNGLFEEPYTAEAFEKSGLIDAY